MPATVNQLAQNFDIDLILPDLMTDEMAGDDGGDPLLDAYPLQYEDFDLIKWNQWENGYGLLGLRGLGGEPDVVQLPGKRENTVAPGYYGERAVLDETEMTKDREAGSANLPADPEERLGIMTQYQSEKAVNRFRKTLSDFLLTGRFTNRSASGSVLHSDVIENYRTFSPAGSGGTGPGWAADPAGAKPIDDLLFWQNQLQLGTSSGFGKTSKLVCQQSVVNDLFATTQIRSVFKIEYGNTPLGLEGLNKILIGYGLPTIVVYNAGYYNTLADAVNRTSAGFTRIMPTKSLIWLGTRPKGQKLGKFALTRNIPLALQKSSDLMENRSSEAFAKGIGIQLFMNNRLPFRYELDVWFNGGPVALFGSASAGLSYT
jgi:hypothetical protein